MPNLPNQTTNVGYKIEQFDIDGNPKECKISRHYPIGYHIDPKDEIDTYEKNHPQ